MRTLQHTALYAALLLLLATAGCDSNSAEDDSDFAVFAQGSWTVTELVISGSDVTANLDARYESDVVFSFVENSNENTRSFDLTASRADDSGSLDLSGRIDIDGDDDIIFFDSDSGPNFELDYRIENTGRIVLLSDDTNTNGAILRNILLNSSLGGEFPEVRMTIERPLSETN